MFQGSFAARTLFAVPLRWLSHLRPRRSRPIFAVPLLACALAASAGTVHADPYLLGPTDKLRIKVVEWQSATGTFRDWSSVSGDYVVSPGGQLSFPIAGEMEAAGKTTAEIAKMLGDVLQQKLALIDRPEASVELEEFRPFYVVGDVQNPGKYPSAPDLTVIKALSIGGGIRRAVDYDQSGARDFINSRAGYAIQVNEQSRLLVKRARLQAESSGATTIQPPVSLKAGPDLTALIAQETAIMAARTRRFELQMQALDELKQLLNSEVESLDKKGVSENRQLSLVKEDLASIGDLAQKGLVVNSRVLSLEQSIAEAEGRILDLGTASLRAKQDINKAKQDEINLQNDRDSEIATDLQQADSDLEEARVKLDMNAQLMNDAAREALTTDTQQAAGRVSFVITRVSGGAPHDLPAEENSAVLPGDLVRVLRLGPETHSD